MAISPDGEQIAYAGSVERRESPLPSPQNDFDAVPVAATEGGPFFSPDGRWLGFASGGVAASGNSRRRTTRAVAGAPNPMDAAWGPDDMIVYSLDYTNGLFKVSAGGGRPKTIIRVANSITRVA